MILVVVNLGKDRATNYGLGLQNSSLPTGEYELDPLMGKRIFSSLTIGAKGDIIGFEVLEPLDPYGSYILKLKRH
jgi:hypothetical protein